MGCRMTRSVIEPSANGDANGQGKARSDVGAAALLKQEVEQQTVHKPPAVSTFCVTDITNTATATMMTTATSTTSVLKMENSSSSTTSLVGTTVIGQQQTIKMLLTDRQKALVLSAWDMLKPKANTIGQDIFMQLFKQHSSLKSMFAFRNVADDKLRDNALFRAHAQNFMATIAGAIRYVDTPDGVASSYGTVLNNLGRLHAKMPFFKPSYFAFFSEAVTSVLSRHLRNAFNDETREAWQLVFAFIIDKLREGYVKEQERQSNVTQLQHVMDGTT